MTYCVSKQKHKTSDFVGCAFELMRAYGTNLFANKLTYLQTKTKGENKNKKTAMCHRTKYQKNFAAKLNIESCVNYNYASSVSGNFFEKYKIYKSTVQTVLLFLQFVAFVSRLLV